MRSPLLLLTILLVTSLACDRDSPKKAGPNQPKLTPANLVFVTHKDDSHGRQAVSVELADAATFSVTDDAPWLNASTANNVVEVAIDSASLSFGVHTAMVSLVSGDKTLAKIPVSVLVRDSVDQVHLAWVSDPATTLTAVWHTIGTEVPSQLQYRAVGEEPWKTVTGAQRPFGSTGKQHEATLTDLSPGTEYEYRMLGDKNAWSLPFKARTAPRGPADFTAIYFADMGLLGRADELDTGVRQCIDDMAALDSNVILPGGDYIYYSTNETRYGSVDATIDWWFHQMQPIASRTPLMPTYGNHDIKMNEGYEPWAARFPTPAGFNERRNFSFDVGDVHFVSVFAVNDSYGISPEAVAWIRQDAQAARARGQRWIVPYMHCSAFADGAHYSSNVALREQLQPLFEEIDAKIVLSSQDQSYERTFPLKGKTFTPTSSSRTNYGASDGISWVKVSPSGRLSYTSRTFPKFKTHPPPSYTAARDNTMHHFARLVVSALGTIKVEIWGTPGNGTKSKVIDSFEYALK